MRDLALASGLSAGGISQIERTGGFQAGTMKALQQALVARGAIFGVNGSVSVKMKWEQGRPPDPKIRAGVLACLNAARKARGQAPLVDMGDER
jgi:hypothetical protein